jgi:predicted NAD/FAD-dependent oxidoreductase
MASWNADPFSFDHGAQCFTVRTPGFREFLAPHVAAGRVREWVGHVVNLGVGEALSPRLYHEVHWVASPNMDSLCRFMAEGLDIRTECTVASLREKPGDGWELEDMDGMSLGMFDWVISTVPPSGTLALFHSFVSPSEPLGLARMQSCDALMLGFRRPWDLPWVAAKIRASPSVPHPRLKWISVNSTKPARDAGVTCLVVHSRKHGVGGPEGSLEEVRGLLLEEFRRVTGIETSDADYVALHRWRDSIVDRTQKSGSWMDSALGLAATGDWCGTSRLEEVWHHASMLADRMEPGLT